MEEVEDVGHPASSPGQTETLLQLEHGASVTLVVRGRVGAGEEEVNLWLLPGICKLRHQSPQAVVHRHQGGGAQLDFQLLVC